MSARFYLMLPVAMLMLVRADANSQGLARPTTSQRVAAFDMEPDWEEANTRPHDKYCIEVAQDFGFSRSGFAGSGGEIGGLVTRSLTPAWYADVVSPPMSYENRLVASGTFAITGVDQGGVYFGWFNDERQGWRPVNQFGLRFEGGRSARVFLDYNTGTWKASSLAPDFVIEADGKRHQFIIEYEPTGNRGGGVVAVTIDGDRRQKDLEPHIKAEGASFNRFGMFNLQRKGAPSNIGIYFDDIRYSTPQGTRTQKFSVEPRWEAEGNRVSFDDCETEQNQDFGYSPTNFAGRRRGEIGGLMWRTAPSQEPIYYADRLETLTLVDRFEASGRVSFREGSSDSGIFLGWFNKDGVHHAIPRGFVGVAIEGPTSIGHYFRPFVGSARGTEGDPKTGAIIQPDGTRRSWRIIYDPEANGGSGRLTVFLDQQEMVMDFPKTSKAEGAALDRFGIFPVRGGGSHLRIYFDDLRYTSRPRQGTSTLR